MKKILITGANSYVGQSVENHLKNWPEAYRVDTLDMIGESWREFSFQGYDAVFHVAGIVHQEKAKNDPAQAELYDRVNVRLAVEAAQKAKSEGVKQFVFMSSASVYGLSAPIGKVVMITKDTPLKPVDHYGISKAKAEEELNRLKGEGFCLTILRPPMIYGKGCKGNYQTMAKLAKKLPVFPYVRNQRSMLYMENLAEFVRMVIDDEAEGVYCPQNKEYTNTSDMVNLIAHANGKGILMIHGFAWALKILSRFTGIVDKAFGSLCYDFELSRYPKDYCVKTLEESILETES
jgi:UDP-glucose 4-epimerase